MRFFDKISALAILIMLFALTTNSNAAKEGDFGLHAGAALANGVNVTVGVPSGVLSEVAITTTSSAGFAYMLSKDFQLEFGFGFLSVTPLAGEDADVDALSTISVMVGGKLFFEDQGPVRPYGGLNVSYSVLPTIESGTTETSSNFMSVGGVFGAMGFINESETVALFIQVGAAYNSFSSTFKNGEEMKSTASSFNLGGSAIGGMIYL